MKPNKSRIGNRIKFLRECRKLSHSDVWLFGQIPEDEIINIEKGKVLPSNEVLFGICKLLRCSVYEILLGE